MTAKYITTPIYYVNDKPHIGHAYTSLACDALARYYRALGERTYFLTGTDEHGQKIAKSAELKGQTPQTFTDQLSQTFRSLTPLLDLTNDDFIRTTEPRHIKAAQAIWQKLMASGHIYLGSYAGWYAVRDEAFYQESELVDGKAPTGAAVEWVEEPSFFFALSKWQEPLLNWYKENPDCIWPESRRNEVMRFVEGGLKDLSISRTSFNWGVPVPDYPEHVMYVWLDALTNYISALGFPDENSSLYQEFWPGAIHVVGKDIVRFHAVYWPAFLMAAGLPLPQKIVAHGWWTVEGEKMSKSLGNAIDPVTLVEQYGLNATRYFLLREVPFGQDGNFSQVAMVNRINSELANNIGNLAQRCLKMVHKELAGQVPDYNGDYAKEALFKQAVLQLANYHKMMQECSFSQALESIIQLGASANAFVDAQAPWQLKKTDPAKMAEVLYVLIESLRYIAVMLSPFIPEAANKLLDQLGVDGAERNFAALSQDNRLEAGKQLPEPSIVFHKL